MTIDTPEIISFNLDITTNEETNEAVLKIVDPNEIPKSGNNFR